jgi:hypothetical protein
MHYLRSPFYTYLKVTKSLRQTQEQNLQQVRYYLPAELSQRCRKEFGEEKKENKNAIDWDAMMPLSHLC